MERGAINGVPVWIRLVELTGGERTVVKEAAGVDGALIETQGNLPDRFRVEFTLIQDGVAITTDIETATLELRAMLLEGGPFTISIPTFGEATNMWLAEPYTLKFFDESRLRVTEGSASLVQGRPLIVLTDNAAGNVQAAISALSEAAALDFGARAPDIGFFQAALDALDAAIAWLEATQALIGSAFQPVNQFAGQIQTLKTNTEQLLQAPQNFASQFLVTATGLLSLVPSLATQGDPRTGSAAVQDPSSDKPAIVYTEALGTGTAFDEDLPPTQGDVLEENASEEDLQEIDEVASATSLTMTGVTSSVCLAITSTNFALVNSVFTVAEALEPAFEKLFTLTNLDYRVYQRARALRAATRQFLSEQAAGLPRLRNFTATRETDVFDILPDLYEQLDSEDQVQAAVESLCQLNSIPEPYRILPETTLKYLDPLV